METIYNMDECFDLIIVSGNKIIVADMAFSTTKILKHYNIDNDQLKQLVDWFNAKHTFTELLYFQTPKLIASCFVKVIPIGLYQLRQAKLDELLS